MGRLLAFLLGGLALALYAPPLFLSDEKLADYQTWCQERLGAEWYGKLFGSPAAAPAAPPPSAPPPSGASTPHRAPPAAVLPGVFAGLALVLLAVRGRDGGGAYHPN